MPSGERLKRQLLELSIITLITVVVWIAYGVYNALSEPAVTNITQAELKPIPKVLTAEQFKPLEDRLQLDEEVLSSFALPAQDLTQVARTPTPIPATPSAEATTAASP